MALQYEDLDDITRECMVDELDLDVAKGSLYLSGNLTDDGKSKYEGILREAILSGNDDTMAQSLASLNCMAATTIRRKPSGGTTTVKMRRDANVMLSEGEFNRFYIRGLCLRAMSEGIENVEIYRAKEVRDPRPESQAKVGASVSAEVLLEDLRNNPGVDTALGLPAGPNSGLSVRLAR